MSDRSLDDARVADAEPVHAQQRRKLIGAIGDLCLEQGFANVRIGDITSRATVAKRTFYVHFADKEDAFLAAYEEAEQLVLRTLALAAAAQETPYERIQHSLVALLELMAEHPSLPHLLLIEAWTAGPRASVRRTETVERIADLYLALHEVVSDRYAPPAPITRTRALAAVGAVEIPIATTMLREGPSALPALATELSRAVFSLVHGPTLGAETA
ncbi:MAG: TetR/AcrR family transcriptional regulator [Solirubrobacteraceae bacterium]|nr:TetR/AcrR family transcriptional regulator [Solirubrobacteraceae bacterium]